MPRHEHALVGYKKNLGGKAYRADRLAARRRLLESPHGASFVKAERPKASADEDSEPEIVP